MEFLDCLIHPNCYLLVGCNNSPLVTNLPNINSEVLFAQQINPASNFSGPKSAEDDHWGQLGRYPGDSGGNLGKLTFAFSCCKYSKY